MLSIVEACSFLELTRKPFEDYVLILNFMAHSQSSPRALPDVTYRKAAAKDFPEILGLIRGSVDNLLKDHGFFESSPFASTKQAPIPQTGFPWFEMEIREDSEGFWVAEVDGKLAGITLSWVRGSLWYLAHLFVSPAYQGLDIGRNLMDRAMRHQGNTPITNRALVTFAYNRV